MTTTKTVGARVGNEDGYEVVRGVRVECGDGEAYDGVPIICWDCDAETVRAFAAKWIGHDIDWSSAWDSPLPSREGWREAAILMPLADAAAMVRQINAAAEVGVVSSRGVQYDHKTDAVIYGPATDGWTRADWLRLAAAALDQAGTPGSARSDGPAIAELADLLEDETGRDADGNCTDCGAAGHGYPDCPPALRGLADEQGDSP